jgi:POT family proton-dependent oligopeptide transporter
MSAAVDKGFFGHPRGLSTLFFTEMWERFSYYGMRAILLLYMTAAVSAGGMGLSAEEGAAIYGLYTAGVYMAAIPGGFVADKLLGLRHAVLLGGVLIALGHFSMALGIRSLFFFGLVSIVAGTGLLKPNISAIVGKLYAADDLRRDAGFSIFYMGINLGAFIAPLMCGWFAQSDSFKGMLASWGMTPEMSWHWGFGLAGIGMTVGVIQYVLGKRNLGDAGAHFERAPNASMLWLAVLGACAFVGFLFWRFFEDRNTIIVAGTLIFCGWYLKQAEPGVERKRALAVLALFVFAALFWAGFEQAGSSLNRFADRVTQNSIFGWTFPSSYHQSTNSIFLIIFAPIFAGVWLYLAKTGREPSSPIKFAAGLLFVAAGFVVMAVAARISAANGNALVSPMWLTLCFLLHTIGELCLSPVGLSTMTKLAPARLAGSVMGVWFLATSVGNYIGGQVAGQFEKFPLPDLFGAVSLTCAVAGVILLLLTKPIKNLMSGVN